MGGPGTSKTTSWLNIAKWSVETGSDAHFHVIDTDRTVTRMLHGQYSMVSDHLTHHLADSWPDYVDALDLIYKEARPQDWVIVDMAGSAWPAVQEYFTEQVFGSDIGNYFLEARIAKEQRDQVSGKKGKNLGAFDGWVDWQVINAMYNSWEKRLLFKSKFNVLCCTPADPVNRDTDSAESIALYGTYGLKPMGQKYLGFHLSTVIITEKRANGVYTLTTVKDRERRELVKAPVTDFTETYLLDVAGWKL